jgi:predicted metal-dependent enzyme (double-stranded beta helix superfamily)
VIVAVEGQELNRVYRRAGGNGPGQERIELEREVMVEPGRGIAFMPDDIHSIHTAGSVPTRHLHVYGLALEKLDGRKAYDAETGEVKPYNVNFLRPTAGVA